MRLANSKERRKHRTAWGRERGSTYDLSQRHDVRPLVVQTLLTYLELEGILEATGPFYSEYKFKSDRPIREIIAQFDPSRREFLASVFERAIPSRIWSTLDVQAATRELGEPRGRIVAALGYLEERGSLTVQATGSRLGYRLLRDDFDQQGLLDLLVDRFRERESRDVSRVRSMLDFVSEPGCLTARLTSYFGEELPERCGHCGPCFGVEVKLLPEPEGKAFGAEDRAIVKGLLAEKYKALETRRQLARFLCGLASPATGRGKLNKDPRFGALADFPFSRVLKLVEAAKD